MMHADRLQLAGLRPRLLLTLLYLERDRGRSVREAARKATFHQAAFEVIARGAHSK